MKLILIVEIIVLSILLTALSVFAYEYFKFAKIKKLYKKDYYRGYLINKARGYYPLMPKPGSKSYESTERLIREAGWNISVERFYLYKWIIFIAALSFMVSVQTTNLLRKAELVVANVNYNKTMLDVHIQPAPENIKLEQELFRYTEEKLTKGREIYKKQNEAMYIDYIEGLIRQKGTFKGEAPAATAARIFQKIKLVRFMNSNIQTYILSLLTALLLFQLPNLIGSLKIKLIEDKKDWEVLNCIFAFSIFGRLPPYSIKTVLESMEMVTEIYRPLIAELLESVKKGKGDKVFDDILEKTDNEDMYELFEIMKLASDTGLLNTVDDVDEMASDNLKWLEIKGIKRRKVKRLYAMIPVAILFLLGGIYFAYGLTVISNPTNLIPK